MRQILAIRVVPVVDVVWNAMEKAASKAALQATAISSVRVTQKSASRDVQSMKTSVP